MSFTVPIALLGLLTLLVPVILHLIKQAKVEELEWAAMDFLTRKEATSMSRRSLKNIPLMLARMGILLFVILALARPVGSMFDLGKEKPQSVFILLDRSPEMGAVSSGKMLLDQALEQLQSALGDYDEGTRVYLINGATAEVMPVLSPENLPLLATTRLTDRPTSVSRMMSITLSEIERGNYGRSEVWIAASDHQDSWNPQSPQWADIKKLDLSQVTVRSFLYPAAEEGDLSLALERVSFADNLLTLEVQIQGGEPGEVVTLSGEWENGSELKEQVVLQEGQELYLLSLVTESKQGAGRLSLEADANNVNNELFFSYGPPQEVWTIIVVDDFSSDLASYLKRASGLSSRPQQKVRLITPEDMVFTDLSTFDQLVWASNGESTEAREVIDAFVEAGGTAVIYPSPKAESHAEGWYFSEVATAPPGAFFSIESWREKSGPWRNSRNGSPLPVGELKSVLIAKPEEGVSALAKWANGWNALSEVFTGSGRIYLVSTLPLQSWSNMENLALHLIIAQRVLEESSLRQGGGYLQLLTDSSAERKAGFKKEGGRTVAVNRSPRQSSQRLTDGEASRILKSGQLEVSGAGKRPMRPWLYPTLTMVLAFIMLESLLKVIPKLRIRRKEVSHV